MIGPVQFTPGNLFDLRYRFVLADGSAGAEQSSGIIQVGTFNLFMVDAVPPTGALSLLLYDVTDPTNIVNYLLQTQKLFLEFTPGNLGDLRYRFILADGNAGAEQSSGIIQIGAFNLFMVDAVTPTGALSLLFYDVTDPTNIVNYRLLQPGVFPIGFIDENDIRRKAEIVLAAELTSRLPNDWTILVSRGGGGSESESGEPTEHIPPFVVVEAQGSEELRADFFDHNENIWQMNVAIGYVTELTDTLPIDHSQNLRKVLEAISGILPGYDADHKFRLHGIDILGTDDFEDPAKQARGDIITVVIGCSG
jgi:hypothetical protein